VQVKLSWAFWDVFFEMRDVYALAHLNCQVHRDAVARVLIVHVKERHLKFTCHSFTRWSGNGKNVNNYFNHHFTFNVQRKDSTFGNQHFRFFLLELDSRSSQVSTQR
jgi:hypothetical protein